jgi:hypothetical protein
MEEPAAEAVEPPVLGGDGEHDHYGDPDDEVHDQRRVRHRRHEREHEAGVSHHERPQHEARPRGHACEQPHREQHRADEPGPARRHEQPVPAPVLVAHDRVTGDVAAVVVLPVPARDVRAQLVRQRRDQRRRQRSPAVCGSLRPPARGPPPLLGGRCPSRPRRRSSSRSLLRPQNAGQYFDFDKNIYMLSLLMFLRASCARITNFYIEG